MTKEELEKEAEGKYCKGCKWRIEQCLWAWRKTNGLKEPNEKNCSCKEVPAYITGAEPREKQIAELEDKLANADYQLEGRDNEIRELEAQIEKMKCGQNCKHSYLYQEDRKCKFTYCDCINCKDKWELRR